MGLLACQQSGVRDFEISGCRVWGFDILDFGIRVLGCGDGSAGVIEAYRHMFGIDASQSGGVTDKAVQDSLNDLLNFAGRPTPVADLFQTPVALLEPISDAPPTPRAAEGGEQFSASAMKFDEIWASSLIDAEEEEEEEEEEEGAGSDAGSRSEGESMRGGQLRNWVGFETACARDTCHKSTWLSWRGGADRTRRVCQGC